VVVWPPITPITRAPVRTSSNASQAASSWSARSIEAKVSPFARVRWNQRYARASGVAS
jgi:hypothetical protein